MDALLLFVILSQSQCHWLVGSAVNAGIAGMTAAMFRSKAGLIYSIDLPPGHGPAYFLFL